MKALSSFLAMFDLSERIRTELDRLGDPPSTKLRNYAGRVPTILDPAPLHGVREWHKARAREWREEVAALEQQIVGSDAAAAAILREPLYAKDLHAVLSEKAKLRSQKFADPRARLWLLDATAVALGQRSYYEKYGTTPEPPGVGDWQSALEAVDTLASLQRRGVSLARAITGHRRQQIPFDWLDRLKAGLQSEAAAAQKPHKDKFIVEREACKTFAEHIYFYFDHEVPLSLVERFGALIDYQPDSLSRSLPKWKKQFGTD